MKQMHKSSHVLGRAPSDSPAKRGSWRGEVHGPTETADLSTGAQGFWTNTLISLSEICVEFTLRPVYTTLRTKLSFICVELELGVLSYHTQFFFLFS